MSQSSLKAPVKNFGLTFWIIAVTIAVIVTWAVWHFGRLAQHQAPNNPGVSTSSALILKKA